MGSTVESAYTAADKLNNPYQDFSGSGGQIRFTAGIEDEKVMVSVCRCRESHETTWIGELISVLRVQTLFSETYRSRQGGCFQID